MSYDLIWRKRAQWKVKKILALGEKYRKLTDCQLKHKTIEFRNRLSDGTSPDSLLVEAFAAVREASRRVLGMEPYPVQLLAAIALHEGKIAEQKTGEGKTLSCVPAAYLNALSGDGVHVVTVNDYLAARDAAQMGKVHAYMGLSVGVVTGDSSQPERKEAYGCDITYVTNSELGFDYLRDNMAASASSVVQRGLNYAIIDEVDSILIDEARTPLIISGGGRDVSALYTACNAVVRSLKRGEASREFNRMEAILGDIPEETGDYIVHEKEKAVALTKEGIKKVSSAFGVENYADASHRYLSHAISQCLYANTLMKKDKDYLVKDGKVYVIDVFTGRVREGHEFSDGLHQAIEAKERVQVQKETRTVATVTYQRFFCKYKKVSGMTGTASSQKREFKDTYGLATVVIPTNRPVARRDRECKVYATKKAKYGGVIREVRESMLKGQPVLIGTASVKASEELDYLLGLADIPHQVLNAKQDEKEAEIIARAGEKGTVTVATNMAGRGTDIIPDEYALKAGGLKVIGTELHDSVRIDDQLKGRSGRQGDPGESVSCVSAEDRMLRLYGGIRLAKMAEKAGESDAPLPRRAAKYARHAQRIVEDNHFGARKNVLEYDIVNDKQREQVYKERREILRGTDMEKKFLSCLAGYADALADMEPEAAMERFRKDTGLPCPDPASAAGRKGKKKKRELSSLFYGKLEETYLKGKGKDTKREQAALLMAMDAAWMEQIRALECLQQCISYQGYMQNDPASTYALEARALYGKMKEYLYRAAVRRYFPEGGKDHDKE